MKKVAIVLALLAMSGQVLATSYGNRTYNSANNHSWNHANGGSANATGGSASAKSSASAKANGGTGVGIGLGGKGGSAQVTNRNRNQQGQSQGQYQANVGINGQSQSAVGSGNSTSVNVEGDTVKYEAAPIAPNAVPGNPTAPCIATFSGSAGTAVISLGASGFVRDSVCTWGEVARVARESGNLDIANKALYLMFEEAESQTGTIASLQKKSSPASGDDGFESLNALAVD